MFCLFGLAVVCTLGPLGVALLCLPRISISRTRELHRPVLIIIGLLCLGTAALVTVIECLKLLTFMLMESSIENRGPTPEKDAARAHVDLQFGVVEMIVLGVAVALAGLFAFTCSERKGDARGGPTRGPTHGHTTRRPRGNPRRYDGDSR